MKTDLIKLIESTQDIEKLFHIAGGGSIPEFEKINDVQEFQDWLQEVKFELRDIYDRTHDHFVWETLNTCDKNMNGTTDRRVFNELSGKLRAIKKNIEKYYQGMPDTLNESISEEKMVQTQNQKPLIFISHSSKNKEQVQLLADLLRAINLQPQQDIFCSSLPGYDIPLSSEDRIFDFLRSKFLEYKIHVIFIHSHEYYASPVCLNEMGAAWALKSTQTSLLLPGFSFGDMKGVINGERIAIKLDNDITEVKDKLNQVRRILEDEFSLTPVSDTIWEQARDKFIEEINCPKEQGQLSDESKTILEKAAADSTGRIITPFNLEDGTSIQIGNEMLASELPDRRNYLKWEAALKECIKGGYIERKTDTQFAITAKGFDWVDKNWVVQVI